MKDRVVEFTEDPEVSKLPKRVSEIEINGNKSLKINLTGSRL